MFTGVRDVKVSVATKIVFSPASREQVREGASWDLFAARETLFSKLSVMKQPLVRGFLTLADVFARSVGFEEFLTISLRK